MKKTPLVRKTPLRAVSKKRSAGRGLRKKVREEVLDRDKFACQANIYGLCSRHATDVHEILTRGRGGSIYDVGNCLSLCRSCHSFITEHPAWAEEHGFMLPAWSGHAEMVAAARARAMFVGMMADMEQEDE